MIQREVEIAVADGLAGSWCELERVLPRDPPGVWHIFVRCAKCGTFRFTVIERAGELGVREQAVNEVLMHEGVCG